MTNSDRRWLAEPRRTRSIVAGVFCALLIAVGIASASYAGTSSRVLYVCDGESPRPCTCYRYGEEPAGFRFNRGVDGPAEGVKTAVLITLGVGLVTIAVVVAHRKVAKRRDADWEPDRLFKVLATVGTVLVLAAGVLWVAKVTSPCSAGQGALGSLASVWSGACDW